MAQTKAVFENGATRSEHALMYDLIPIQAHDALGERMTTGFGFHGGNKEENWKKGGPLFFKETYRHAVTHLLKYQDGWTDDDHLAAAFTNLMMLVWWERKGKVAWFSNMPAPVDNRPEAPAITHETDDPVLKAIIDKFNTGHELDSADKQYISLLQQMVKGAETVKSPGPPFEWPAHQ